jgi:UDP:flavonoid glycosyltransferase YjiC (YdhE family)
VLHPDVAEFIRLPAVPQNHFFLGMCDWSPSTAPPDWWGRLLADPRPKVLVALGSSGPVRILPDVLRTLQELQVAVIVATSGRDVPVPPGVYAAGLLPLVDIMKLADLVISHGGSPLVYPALAAGCPSLGIPSNADQHLSTDLLIRSGAGLGLRVEEASASRLKHSIQKLLSEPDFRNAARQWQATFAQYDFKTLFPKFVGKALHLDQGTTGDAV